MTRKLQRRQLLRGILASGAAVSIPLPLLDFMLNDHGTALAQGGSLPVRYMTWFFGNGVIPALWVPATTGSDWQLTPELEPLAAFKGDLTVISGLGQKVDPEESTHWNGQAAALTGTYLPEGLVSGLSIDQIVADAIVAPTRYRSLELGVTDADPGAGQLLSLYAVAHRGRDVQLRPAFDPKVVFNRLFGDMPVGTPSGETPSPLTGVRRSVLDAVVDDGQRLRGRLGARDQARLDSHMEAIRAMEARLSASVPLSCGSPQPPSVGREAYADATPEVNSAMTDLAVLALSCGLTQVVTYAFTLGAAHVVFRGLGPEMNDDFHDTICHTDPGVNSVQNYQPRVHKAVLYTMKCFAEMLAKMKATPEGAGNLLDQSLIYATSDIAFGKDHSGDDYPLLLAGKAGGRLSPGRHLREQGGNLSQALFSIAQLMGLNLPSIGSGGGLVTKGVLGL